jgi:hypothetical protein
MTLPRRGFLYLTAGAVSLTAAPRFACGARRRSNFGSLPEPPAGRYGGASATKGAGVRSPAVWNRRLHILLSRESIIMKTRRSFAAADLPLNFHPPIRC